MTTEGAYVYSCPFPDSTPGESPITVPMVSDFKIVQNHGYVQSLIDQLSAQRQEIETLKGALELVTRCLTEQQRETLRYTVNLLIDIKK